MRYGCKTAAEKAWLVTGLAALVLQLLSESGPTGGGLWLAETLMVLLTFPLGPVVILFLAIGADLLRDSVDVSWLIDWSTLLLAGYLQWFWLLPEIRRRNQLTTLNLSSPIEIPAPAVIAPPAETASPVEAPAPVKIATPAKTALPVETASPVETVSPVKIATAASPDDALTRPEIIAPVVFDVAAFVPVLAEFDEAGLSALDRVLRAHETSPPAPDAVPSPVESLFLTAQTRA